MPGLGWHMKGGLPQHIHQPPEHTASPASTHRVLDALARSLTGTVAHRKRVMHLHSAVQGVTMLRCALLVALLGAASAANPQARLERTSIETATNKLLRGSVSAEAAARIENVLNSLGSSNITEPTQQYNPDLPDQGPPVQVPATQPAPWHAIARPPNALCAVSFLCLPSICAMQAPYSPVCYRIRLCDRRPSCDAK